MHHLASTYCVSVIQLQVAVNCFRELCVGGELLAPRLDDRLEVFPEPLHVFPSLDSERPVGLVQFQRHPDLWVHFYIVPLTAVVVLGVDSP